MPERETIKRARKDARQGKAPSTQAGEFVREEIEHVREGKHGARSTKQAIAIGLSKARRVPAKKGTSARTRTQAERDLAKGRKRGTKKVSAKRSRAVLGALRHEGHRAASSTSLAKQARKSAKRRSASNRSAAAKKAARTRARNSRSTAKRS